MPSKLQQGVHAASRYSHSQNFLTSARLVERILGLSDILPSDHVLEIGAGKGHITRQLALHCKKLTAVEIDPQLHGALRARYGHLRNLHLCHGDFLKMPLPKGPYKVFANLPFCHTTAILRRLTGGGASPSSCWLIMEKGAAKRFMGRPNENQLSLGLKPYFGMRIAYHFSREDFHPAPRVETVLLHIHKKEAPDLPLSQRAAYERFLSQCFEGKSPLSRRQVKAALATEGLKMPAQSATLLYVQWLCLFRWHHNNSR